MINFVSTDAKREMLSNNLLTRLCPAKQAARSVMWLQFQSDDLLRANTSHLRIMSKGALAAWIEPRFGIPVLLTSCQKGPQKGPGNRSTMCSLCSLTSLFEVFCLKPSKSWFQTTSRQNAVSWVHGTFAEINYYPHIHRCRIWRAPRYGGKSYIFFGKKSNFGKML